MKVLEFRDRGSATWLWSTYNRLPWVAEKVMAQHQNAIAAGYVSNLEYRWRPSEEDEV